MTRIESPQRGRGNEWRQQFSDIVGRNLRHHARGGHGMNEIDNIRQWHGVQERLVGHRERNGMVHAARRQFGQKRSGFAQYADQLDAVLDRQRVGHLGRSQSRRVRGPNARGYVTDQTGRRARDAVQQADDRFSCDDVS